MNQINETTGRARAEGLTNRRDTAAPTRRLYDDRSEKSSCGVGFITSKDGVQSHEVIQLGHEALCEVPHRGGMSSEGVGDGAGVNIDLSEAFFSKILGRPVKRGAFGVANFFFPIDESKHAAVKSMVESKMRESELPVLLWRETPVNLDALNPAAVAHQCPIIQLIFGRPDSLRSANDPLAFERLANHTMIEIERAAYSDPEMEGFFPCSMSARTVVYKGRLNSNELVPYFKDLTDEDQKISVFMFHTRFSTNTDPASHMAQPFCRVAHNGELNTDKKNRLSENAIAKQQGHQITFPKGQSDSARLDQTVTRRIVDDRMDIVEVVLAMMPPAWENDMTIPQNVRAMLEYFSLSEEKIDGPAALIFSDGVKVGARLDRLGLRPLRSIETDKYVAVTSEAGQIEFPADRVIRRGRIEAGGMLYYDHARQRVFNNEEALAELAEREDYQALVKERCIRFEDLPVAPSDSILPSPDWPVARKYVAYGLNQESFKFLLDPTIQSGAEKVSAMGYDLAINAISNAEGGMSKYFSQRFAQVTNPPLDSIRELDGMTLRVSLGSKPLFTKGPSKQILLESPVLFERELATIRAQADVRVETLDILYEAHRDAAANERALEAALTKLHDDVIERVRDGAAIIILSDRSIDDSRCPIPLLLATAQANQALIEAGLRFNASLILETGQLVSSHDLATALGFGAHAACPISVHLRLGELGVSDVEAGFRKFRKGIEKALLKTMGKFGLCTVESYIGGEFFEANFLDTQDPRLAPLFSNVDSPVGGAGFSEIAKSAADWFFKSQEVHDAKEVPLLGLFKERQDGAGHSYGAVAVREYTSMTEEWLAYTIEDIISAIFKMEERSMSDALLARLALLADDTTLEVRNGSVPSAVDAALSDFGAELPSAARKAIAAAIQERRYGLNPEEKTAAGDDLSSAFAAYLDASGGIEDSPYKLFGYQRRTPAQIDRFRITPAYRVFIEKMDEARRERPPALRDLLDFPPDVRECVSLEDFSQRLGRVSRKGNWVVQVVGLAAHSSDNGWTISRTGATSATDLEGLAEWIRQEFPGAVITSVGNEVTVTNAPEALNAFLGRIQTALEPIPLSSVQKASEITPALSSAAMSHGALTGIVHEAVSQGANIAGALSNSGEGGERASRFNTLKSSSIKQIASGRFGVWAGYFADPLLREVEIKIAQGAKPGEGGQLPSRKVTVEIAASRGGTPGIELVSPPPHHDTYSIEDLAQLIHDAKASRARVVVKLVSSEGIGTIAVGVAKAGADVINVAGATGGTGAAQVTSLKNTGRASEIGIAEVHKALSLNGIRQKVILRSSNAHQTGSDVVKSAILGADSFEFGTTALMMLKCVMAKNCNVKCPAGLTTNPEVYQGDARALAQFFLNVAHDVREILARLGYSSLKDIRGKTRLLSLLDHEDLLGRLDVTGLLAEVDEKLVERPIYREADYQFDEETFEALKSNVLAGADHMATFSYKLTNRNKSFGGRLAIDVERWLNHTMDEASLRAARRIIQGKKGRWTLQPETVHIKTDNSAGQSFGVWLNEGFYLEHTGTCNDGVGKGMCGGLIVVKSPGGGSYVHGENVLIGNFALFGASGGQLYVSGEAGDRFAVRNSGSLAVVEGVGDFCCEYMTSGVVMNLGGFGKGFCNGMSGGAAYQYDPEGMLERKYSAESVLVKRITDGGDEAEAHERLIRYLLEEHVRRTDSGLAKRILDRWEYERQSFKYCIPLALYSTQTASGIAESMERGAIVAELSLDVSKRELAKLAAASAKGEPLLSGAVPGYGEVDSDRAFQLINSYAYVARAVEMAKDQLKRSSPDPDPAQVDALAWRLIATQDPKLVDTMAQEARLTLERFDLDALASKLAAKRIRDYKTAMIDRDVQETHTLTAAAWILERQRKNSDASAHESQFDAWQAERLLEKIIVA